ncbi:hypothetical protein PMY35_07620 [Clostridium tertium]|uniref:hypothetical protein n=1 Tax=Clostridium tertium TaxID=1559 RepID=UPI00189F634C|nr:hypothetical protein [Clostridium tertium]MDB1947687.1 hypothetical protein [Clostridium tertium]
MEQLKLNTREFVELGGTEKQKATYEKTNKLKADTKKSIKRRLEKTFEIEETKEGRATVFLLTKRNEPVLDNYEDCMEVILCSLLAESPNNTLTITTSTLMEQMGVVNEKYNYVKRLSKEGKEEFCDKNGIMLRNFNLICNDSTLKNKVNYTLENLEKRRVCRIDKAYRISYCIETYNEDKIVSIEHRTHIPSDTIVDAVLEQEHEFISHFGEKATMADVIRSGNYLNLRQAINFNLKSLMEDEIFKSISNELKDNQVVKMNFFYTAKVITTTKKILELESKKNYFQKAVQTLNEISVNTMNDKINSDKGAVKKIENFEDVIRYREDGIKIVQLLIKK